MKDFEKFKSSIKTDYRMIHDKTSCITDSFIEEHAETASRRNEIYAELFAMELLERYHEWNNH